MVTAMEQIIRVHNPRKAYVLVLEIVADALIIWLRALEHVRKESDGLILTSGFLNLLEEDLTLSDSSSWHKIVLKLIEPSCSFSFIRWYLLHSTRFTNKQESFAERVCSFRKS